MVDLPRLPANVCALYFIATVATEGKTFADVPHAGDKTRALLRSKLACHAPVLMPTLMPFWCSRVFGHPLCAQVKSSKMRLVDWKSGTELCRYMPAMSGAHTALFMCRITRASPQAAWKMSTIGEVDHTARDWGTLVPEVSLSRPSPAPGVGGD